ncbi:MAG: cyclic nucleotide-binding domain-containing protein, partial [Acidobacteriaceae bacterium]|nr:cyclic nucleotide-binding domain-containing protein [Acidobacteriaceae bacterium]
MLNPTPHQTLYSALAELGNAVTKSKGERLFAEGDTALGVYVIRKGHVALILHRRVDRDALTQVAGPGAIVGLPAVMTGRWF